MQQKCLFCNLNPQVGAVFKETAIGAIGLGFNFRASQIGRSVAKPTTFPLSCIGGTLNRGDGPVTRYTLRRNTAGTRFYFFDLHLQTKQVIK